MISILSFLCAFLFLSQGNCQCSIANVTISQSETGKTVQNKPEWEVRISNDCVCTQSDLKLSCDGFHSVESIDSSILAKSGGECLINNGEPVSSSTNFTFNYAWDTSFPFQPLSSQPNCS